MMKSAFAAPPKKAKPAAWAEPRPVKPAGTWPTPIAPVEESTSTFDTNKLLSAMKVAPELAIIEWDGDRTRAAAPVAAPVEISESAPEHDEETSSVATHGEFDPAALDPRRRKIRERYIGARFPGVARTIADLQSSDRVIKAARLYFEDDEAHLALELLDIAAQEAPHESPIWLARLEILFLTRDAEGFLAAARAFHETHPRHEAWPEVERLGRALVPGEALFGATSGPRDHDHYGPWPHTPNWIQAPWDLTPEIAAADFHRSASRLARRGVSA